jgi:hypothetical protein
MSGSVNAQYIPRYPVHDSLPDPEIRTFITNFYRVSDKQDLNELWVDQFTEDAQIAVGPAKASGRESEFISFLFSFLVLSLFYT